MSPNHGCATEETPEETRKAPLGVWVCTRGFVFVFVPSIYKHVDTGSRALVREHQYSILRTLSSSLSSDSLFCDHLAYE